MPFRNFRLNISRRSLFQCLVATAFISVAFLAMDVFMGAGLVSSLGASTFIVLAMPHSRSARANALMSGYVLGTLFGTGCSLLAQLPWILALGVSPLILRYFAGGIAVGLTMLAMVSINVGHPPAAGLALGYALDPWDLRAVIFVLSTGLLLTLVKRLFRRRLYDLT
jgi:CBS domain-containing membrane protein